jgi:hypothetical protein
MAVKDGAKNKKAQAVLLEPVMAVEVVVPEDFMGDVIGNLLEPPRPHRRHGRPGRREGGDGQGATEGNVRLCHRSCVR